MGNNIVGAVSKSFGKGLLWTICTLIFGLLQLWIVLANDFVISDYDLDLNKVITDGTLLFFTSAVVASICTDYYLGEKTGLHKMVALLVYFIYPFLVLTLCIWLFTLIFSSYSKTINFKIIENIQIAVICMTILYAITTKAIMFFQEDK